MGLVGNLGFRKGCLGKVRQNTLEVLPRDFIDLSLVHMQGKPNNCPDLDCYILLLFLLPIIDIIISYIIIIIISTVLLS